MSVALPAVRDVKWLTLEVCRQFQRGSCSRKDTECKFAHPPKSCHVVNGCVIACFDFLKGRCFRESCKYLHPPSHLKAHLEITGRNNLIQQKMATMLQQMHFVLPGSCLPSVSLGAGTGISHAPFVTPVSHGIGLLTTEMLPVNHQVILPSAPRVIVQTSDASHQKVLHSDKMEVCREFQRGSCCRRETDCRFAHPTDSTMIDSADNTVTMCMDHVRGNCNREKCRYFHPTAHQHIQLQTGQTVSQSTATATNQSSAKILKRHLETSVDMAVPHALLAKRLALEQTGAAGGLSFQQLVSPTHLQTATALLPTEVPMMLGAPAVPAVSPYVAAATANASQIILK